MAQKFLIAGVAFAQAVALFVTGFTTVLMSQSLMQWLIWLVGYERALGKDSVVRAEGGGVLLTNPAAMMLWMTPFLLLGALQISSAVMLVWLGYCHLKSGVSAPANSRPNRDR